jgi:hypothetical protein
MRLLEPSGTSERTDFVDVARLAVPAIASYSTMSNNRDRREQWAYNRRLDSQEITLHECFQFYNNILFLGNHAPIVESVTSESYVRHSNRLTIRP